MTKKYFVRLSDECIFDLYRVTAIIRDNDTSFRIFFDSASEDIHFLIEINDQVIKNGKQKDVF